MALAPCRECGREVSTEALACPQCGAPIPSRPTGSRQVVQSEPAAPSIDQRSSPFRQISVPSSPRVERPHVRLRGGTESHTVERRGSETRIGLLLMALALVVVAGGVWWNVPKNTPSVSSESPAPAEIPVNPPAGVSVPASRRLSATDRQASIDAMQALQALRSVTTAGVTYSEYEKRVLDASIAIDRYLRSHGGDDPAIVKPIQHAMSLYVFAKSTWSAALTMDFGEMQSFILRHREQTKEACPAAFEAWEDPASAKNHEHSTAYYRDMLRESMSPMWRCARESLEEANRAIAARS